MPLWRDGDCTTAQNSAAPIRPVAPIARKPLRQPYSWASQPISGANATSEKYCEELKMALAVPRSEWGNQLATIRALAGKDGHSAKPRAKRSANRLINTGMRRSEKIKAWLVGTPAHRVIARRWPGREP